MVDIPVIGICEAAMRMASLLGHRFTIVTTQAISLPAMDGLIRRYGMADRGHARAAGVPVLALEDPSSGAVAKVRAEIRAAIAEDRAECILLGCAGMADLARDLTEEMGLPVIDGVAAAVKLAEAVVGLGLSTSKVGGYARPAAKPYTGMLAGFAP
jgi:allantoin racemase